MPASGLVARGAPRRPRFFRFLIASIILLSAAVLALAAYAQSISGNYYYDSSVTGFLLFIPIWTWLVYGGMLATEHYAPEFYYRIVFAIGQLLSVIFWITGWAWAASWADYTLSFDNYSSRDSIRGAWMVFGEIIAACAAIGAAVWLLCILVMIGFCAACNNSTTSAPANDVELTNTSSSRDKNQPIDRTES